MIRIAHTADIHARRDRMDEALASLNSLRDEIQEKPVDLVMVSGDVWDSAMSATGASRFPEILEAFRDIAAIAPVVMVYGTPSHDLSGSLEVFERLETRHGITILRPGVAYHLHRDRYDAERVPRVSPAGEIPEYRESLALVLGIPEPSKEFVVANVDGISKAGADEEIREGMRRFLLGLAALRKQYTHLPAVVAYHGQIAGATLQNGQKLAAGAGLAIGRDDLASIGADYYALGDIHLPQQIGDMPAYYPGSVYPCDWGETHQCGWNRVYIGAPAASGFGEIPDVEPDLFSQLERETHPSTESASVTLERVDYPHPRNQKIIAKAVREISGFVDVNDHTPVERGCRVWLEIACTAEEAQQIDTAHFEDRLKLQGALEGSRVTLKVAPRETVRAASITEHKALVDKVKLWEDHSATQAPDGVYDLAEAMEADLASETRVSGARIRIDRLVLRGAIGIWKGLHRDDVEIDFQEFDPGLIALVGGNGYGKTTLIENMHPWPTLFTRDGKLADQFRLRDSRRELYFTDTRTDTLYKSVILIDSQTGNGEYHLYRDSGGDWQSLTNGRKDPYVEEVERVFGSLPMFLRSVFVSQRSTKGNPDLADATKGERKALFLELAGLDHLQQYSVYAREHANELDSEAHALTGRIQAQEEQLEDLDAKRTELSGLRENLKEAERDLQAIADRGAQAKTAMEAAQEAAERQRRIREKLGELNRRIRELTEKLREQQAEHKRAESAAKLNPEDLEKEIQELEAKQQRLNTLYAKKAEIDEVNARRVREYNHTTKLAQEELDGLRKSERAAADKHKEIGFRIDALNVEIHRLNEQLQESESDDVCPVCGQSWPEHKWKEHQEKIEVIKRQRNEKHQAIVELENRLSETEGELREARRAVETYKLPEEPTPEPEPFAKELIELKDDLEWVDIDAKRKQMESARHAQSALAEAAEDIRETQEEIRAVQAQVSSVSQNLDLDAEKRAESAAATYEETRADYAQTQYRIGGLKSEITAAESRVSELELLAEKIGSDRARRDQLLHTANCWRYLEAACGRDGIQALELDALAPSIAQVANELLEAAYGTRFVIEFETTRMSGSGARQKQIESFDINVIDGEHGTSQELKTLSGGEAVWIKKAIYDAFGIIRDRNTGVAFLTAFQDEADGALDPEAKLQYFRMLEAAHARSGRAHTVVITHSPEVQQMIRQRIDMRELRREQQEAVA